MAKSKHISYNGAKPFLYSRLGEDVMATVEKICDLAEGVTFTRTQSYRGTYDVVTALFQTKTGNELEIEFGFNLKGE